MSESKPPVRSPEAEPGASGTYPLAGLFVGMAVCALLLTIVAGSMKSSGAEVWMAAGAVAGGCAGFAIGLYHLYWSGAGVGLLAGAITGGLCAPLAAVASGDLPSIWIGLGIGSLLLIGSALVLRAATRPDPIVPYLRDWQDRPQ